MATLTMDLLGHLPDLPADDRVEDEAAVEKAWADELERRADRALSGESKGTDWSIVRARAAARLGR